MILMQNSYGYTVGLTTNIDLTGATAIRVRLVPPAPGATIDKQLTQSNVVTPATGVIALPIDQGDLTIVGFYQIEAYDETPGRKVPSAVGVFEVQKTLG